MFGKFVSLPVQGRNAKANRSEGLALPLLAVAAMAAVFVLANCEDPAQFLGA